MAPVKAAKKPAPKKAAAPKKAPAAKKVSVIPEGYPWVSPYLAVNDPAAAIAFYEKAFGFTKRFAMPDKTGKIQHAELQHETGVVMLGPACPEMGAKAPSEYGGTPITLYVYVHDVDKTTATAKAAGGTVKQEPKDQFYGDRNSVVVDPEGHVWCLATHIKDIKPEDMHSSEEGCCGGESSCH